MLVTGGYGQLGSDIVQYYRSQGIPVIPIGTKDANISIFDETEQLICDINPTHIIHCAAFTSVDKAEEEKDLTYDVNVRGTQNITLISKKIGAILVYISTDYVFGGEGEKYYDISDLPNPQNYYGFTKYLGETIVTSSLERYYIIRISWVFGLNGSNFVKTMLNLGESNEELSVICDQVGSPTYTHDLAQFLFQLIETEKYGIYHATNEGSCSWYDFAVEIFSQANIDCKVNKITSREYKTIAKRPNNSRLSKRCIDDVGLCRLPSWKSALSHFLSNYKR